MTHQEEKKCLFRFLKEKGVYRKFIKYISNKKHHNMQKRYQSRDSYSIEWCLEEFGVVSIISSLIAWNTTDEGYDFWCNLCKEFDIQMIIKLKEEIINKEWEKII